MPPAMTIFISLRLPLRSLTGERGAALRGAALPSASGPTASVASGPYPSARSSRGLQPLVFDDRAGSGVCTIMAFAPPFHYSAGRHAPFGPRRALAVSRRASPFRASARPPQGPPATPAAVLPVPPNVKAEGLSPIPASIPEDLAPYGAFRRAMFLGWHPTRREILISTIFGNVPQIHSVAGPGMDRRQVTFFRDGASRDRRRLVRAGRRRTSCSARTAAAAPRRCSCSGSIRRRCRARSSRTGNPATATRRGPHAPGSLPSIPPGAAGTAAGTATST